MQEFINSVDFLSEKEEAQAYCARRSSDLAAFLAENPWKPGNLPGVLQIKYQGHSLLWDVAGTELHAGPWGHYEAMLKDADDINILEDSCQFFAFCLARYW